MQENQDEFEHLSQNTSKKVPVRSKSPIWGHQGTALQSLIDLASVVLFDGPNDVRAMTSKVINDFVMQLLGEDWSRSLNWCRLEDRLNQEDEQSK